MGCGLEVRTGNGWWGHSESSMGSQETKPVMDSGHGNVDKTCRWADWLAAGVTDTRKDDYISWFEQLGILCFQIGESE